jgi:hypothetical protein
MASVNMIKNNDIEIQADFLEPIPNFSILRAIHLRQKRYNFKNPLETLRKYKERVIRDSKRNNLLTESVSVPKRSIDIKISGQRCVSVDIRKTKTFEKTPNSLSSEKVSLKPSILPKLRQGLLNINNIRIK